MTTDTSIETPPKIESFQQLALDPRCLSVLEGDGLVVPTDIQAQAIPLIGEGRDLIGISQTGSGKTLAFLLPTLTRLAEGKPRKNAMLIVVPTRELCVQVEKVVKPFAKALHLRSVAIYGGVGIQPQRDDLKRGCHIIVATPGRLLDHETRGSMNLSCVEVLIMDEADRMLDMGFLPDIRRIIRKLPRDRQTLMFSATFPDEIARLTGEMLRNPERITIGLISRPVESVRQALYPVRQEDKTQLLVKIFEEQQIDSAVIFLRTKSRTERLAEVLRKKGYKPAQIHGDRSQKQRELALEGFRSGKYKILVATDLAARGLDVDGISHVINYDIPPNPDDYIHRIGRTARAHAEGDAITFVSPNESSELEAIERTLERNLPRTEWENAPSILTLYRAKGTAASRPRRGLGRGFGRRR